MSRFFIAVVVFNSLNDIPQVAQRKRNVSIVEHTRHRSPFLYMFSVYIIEGCMDWKDFGTWNCEHRAALAAKFLQFHVMSFFQAMHHEHESHA